MTAKQDLLDPILDRMAADGASDLLFAAGHTPTLFVSGQARPVGPDVGSIDAPTIEAILQEVAGAEAWSEFMKAARANASRTFKHRFSHGDHEFLATAADGGILTARFRLIATRRRTGKVSSAETIGRLEAMALKIDELQF